MSAGTEISAIESGALLGAVDEYPPSLSSLQATGGYPGGVTVTDTQIITQTEVIPRFVANPTIAAIRGGEWSDPSTWSAGRVPTDHDRVQIAAPYTVIYSTVNPAHLDGLEIAGRLVFRPTVDTLLKVGNLTVMPTGALQIGTSNVPVAPQVTAQIVIADQPLDLAADPKQYGTGLIALGTVTIHGSTLNHTWTGLDAEPRAGDTFLLAANDDLNWQAGDTLILPDTRQVASTEDWKFFSGQLAPHWEEVTVASVQGNRVELTAPLQFDHRGARDADGVLQLLPHVAVLDRNVVIRSENPEGTRGHVFFNARAAIDIEYARFQDLGRTDAFSDLDSTTYDSSGNVTHVGTNQVGRYAIHFHHVMGPENPTNTGYQFQFVGNTIDGARKWAVAVHDTSFGLVDQNVVYDAQGAGFVTEDGSEIDNVFSNNITIRIVGTGSDGKSGTEDDDYGRGGSGFWFRRVGSQVVGNVAADSFYSGFVVDGYYEWGTLTLPLFRGADKHEPGQGYTTLLSPPGTFRNNEAYGMGMFGLWAAYTTGNNLPDGQPETLFDDLRVWNMLNSGVQVYHTNHLTFDHLLILQDMAAQNRNDTGSIGMSLAIYENQNLVIRNARIEGARTGILAPRSDASTAGLMRPTIIENSILKNYTNIMVMPAFAGGPGNGNSLEVRNVKFGLTPNLPAGPARLGPDDGAANIRMALVADRSDLTQPSVVRVYDYNQVPGDDFQVFYREQVYGYIMPQTDPVLLGSRTEGTIGSPLAGFANLLNWNKFRIATAGLPAPQNATLSHPEIKGLVGPIIDMSRLTPRVVLVTPWEGATISAGSPVRIRYNVIGVMPAGGQVYFSLDTGPCFTTFKDGGLYGVAPGQHTLHVWIATTYRYLSLSFTSATFTVAASNASAADSGAMHAVATALASLPTVNDEAQATVAVPPVDASASKPAVADGDAGPSASVPPPQEPIALAAAVGAPAVGRLDEELLSQLAVDVASAAQSA